MKGKHVSRNTQRKLRKDSTKPLEDMSIKELMHEAEQGNIVAKRRLLSLCSFT